MYNIYSIVILILFDIPRFSVNDVHQIQVAAPSPSSRKSLCTAVLHRYEREHLLNILDSIHNDYRSNFASENVFPVINSTRPTSEIHHATLHRACKRGRRGGALCRFRRRGSRPPLPAIVLANVSTLKSKTDELFHLLFFKREFKDSSILCFIETWLDPLTPDAADTPPGHTLLRADRSIELSGMERGGGICFLVNHRWCNDTTFVSSSCSPELESLTVNCIPFYSRRVFSSVVLMGVYANATSAINQLTTRVLAAETTYPDSVIIILGDFIHTNLKKVLPRYKQHVNCSTRNNKTLDHCYTMFKDAYRAATRAPLGESDHATVVLIPTYRQKLNTIQPTTKTVRKRTVDSTIALKACLDNTDWQMFKDSCTDLDTT